MSFLNSVQYHVIENENPRSDVAHVISMSEFLFANYDDYSEYRLARVIRHSRGYESDLESRSDPEKAILCCTVLQYKGTVLLVRVRLAY